MHTGNVREFLNGLSIAKMTEDDAQPGRPDDFFIFIEFCTCSGFLEVNLIINMSTFKFLFNFFNRRSHLMIGDYDLTTTYHRILNTS